MTRKYVIIGVSAGGIGAMTKLRQLDAQATIIAVSEEPAFPYNKCFLVDYVSSAKTTEQIYTKAPSFFTDNRIDLRLGVKVVQINRAQKTITCHDGTVLDYDALVLAVGGSARTLNILGAQECQGVFPFYTYEQAERIKAWAAKSSTKNILIIGAGLSGLECADALLAYGKNIMIIDGADRPLPHHTTVQSGSYLANAMEQAGVKFQPQATLARIVSKQNIVTEVVLTSGHVYQADMVVAAIGAQPNLDLAKQAGLEIQHNAIVTNSCLQTSDESIFAAGDCALVTNTLTGLPIRSTTWPDAMAQGMTAATNMVGQTRAYAGVVPFLSSSFFGQKFYTGGSLPQQPGDQIVERVADEGYVFVRFDNQHRVLGFNVAACAKTGASYVVDLKRSLVTGCVYTGELLG